MLPEERSTYITDGNHRVQYEHASRIPHVVARNVRAAPISCRSVTTQHLVRAIKEITDLLRDVKPFDEALEVQESTAAVHAPSCSLCI